MFSSDASAWRRTSRTAGSSVVRSVLAATQIRSASAASSNPCSTCTSKPPMARTRPGEGAHTTKSNTGLSSSGWYGSAHNSLSAPSPKGSTPSCTITATFRILQHAPRVAVFQWISALLPLVAEVRWAETFCHGYRTDPFGPDPRHDRHRPRGASGWVWQHRSAAHVRAGTGSPAVSDPAATALTPAFVLQPSPLP